MQEQILETIEKILNSPLVGLLIDAALITWGVSRWKNIPLSRRNYLTILIISFGIRGILKNIN